jgi:hypothetical protein
MMYHACRRPGRYPSMQRRMFSKESAVQRPDLIHTTQLGQYIEDKSIGIGEEKKGDEPAIGGNRTARRPRKRSPQDMMAVGVSNIGLDVLWTTRRVRSG